MADDESPEPSMGFDWIPEVPMLGKIAVMTGIWALIVNVVNIAIGAYAAGQKVVWAGFVSYGNFADNTFTAHNGVEISPGDIVFTIIGVLILAFGILILQRTEEGGVISWFSSFVSPNRWKPLFDFSDGLNVTIGTWLLISGVIFYFAWSIANNTWVDPGIYAVSIPLIGFGTVLPMLEKESENSDE
ncbi:MAG: hypothetical protein QGH13_05160 [Candidatus Thalassarchaeaceae archaeon]|nr:hypothetical protein [Candidatus Thalassarchaeaceae archaeon]